MFKFYDITSFVTGCRKLQGTSRMCRVPVSSPIPRSCCLPVIIVFTSQETNLKLFVNLLVLKNVIYPLKTKIYNKN